MWSFSWCNKVRTGKLEEDDWAKLAEAIGPLSEAEIFIDDIEARSLNGEKELHYLIDTYENSLLIGVKGKTLDALQVLLRQVVQQYSDEHLIVSLDIGGYRQNHIRQLEILATKTAKEVVRTKVAVKLNPMNSFERHVIHEKLSDWRDVYTESEGEGENRAIVIKPKQAE